MRRTLAAVALGAVGITTVQVMTVGGLIAAKAEHIQVLHRHTVLAGAVWCTIITGIRVQVAVGAVGRVGHNTVQAMTAGGLIAIVAENIRAKRKVMEIAAAV